ncbi:hypothetical protein KPH14_012908, partial [Odynerus spinipes]
MKNPPSFKDQLKQILVKFNPRLTVEILNLPIYNYEDFLHYVNERSYICSRSIENQKESRSRKNRVDMQCLQDEMSNEIDSEISYGNSIYDSRDEVTDLKAFRQNDHRQNKPSTSNSKPLGVHEENDSTKKNIELKINQVKDLDKKLNSVKENTLFYVGNPSPSILWEIDDETCEELDSTDDEFEIANDRLNFVANDDVEEPISLLTMLDNKLCTRAVPVFNQFHNTTSLKNWRPKLLPSHLVNKLTQRRIYRGDDGMSEPSKVLRIPVEITIFGEKIKGIVDSGSERSYLSIEAYERVKQYQVHELKPDSTSTAGVRIGDGSVIKSIGGTCFIIDIGDVYGPQWFSVLPELSGNLVLGMDFWLSFKIQVDPYKRIWTLAGSQYSYNLSHRFVFPTELKALSINETKILKDFLDKEFEKFERDSSGVTDLIKHVIELDDTTPHRQKPYRRSERVRNFINEEVDRLLKKGYVTWSNSNWASSPVVAPKANDDWIVVSQNIDEHLSLLSILFEVLREAKLTINREKSSFACKDVKYLGYIIDEFGMRPNPDKIKPILDYPVPKDRTQLRQFNGLVNWYHRHLRNIARVQGPLNKLTSPKVPWRWSEIEQRAFEEVKQALVDAPRLYTPIPGQPFILYTDASDFGLGAILVQKDPDSDKELLIEVLSRPLRGAELHYTTTEKECLAVVWSVEKLRCYLEGMPFKVVTDHQALRWLHGLKNPVGRLARWAIYLLQHNMTVEHKRGTLNEAPDALSRMFDVDVDPAGWEEIVEEAIRNRTQLNSICDQNWYDVKLELVRKHPDRFPDWKIENDRLMYHRPDYAKAIIDDEHPWKIVATPNEINEIMRENHETPQSGHLGRDKTLDRIRQNYYWPGMTQDIKSFVEECDICIKVKDNQNPVKGPLVTRYPQTPWMQIAIDTADMTTRSKKGNSHIIVVQDLSTKYIELFPTRDKKGKTVVKILDTIFDRWGTPQSLISDNGKEYLNKDVANFLIARGVKHITTPLAHPQGNPVERVNRTIKPMIAAFVKDKQNDWDKPLSKLQLAYNTVPHAGTRISPFFLNHGREATWRHTNKPGEIPSVSSNEIDEWVKRMNNIDELRHKIEIQLKNYSDQRLAKLNEDKITRVK